LTGADCIADELRHVGGAVATLVAQTKMQALDIVIDYETLDWVADAKAPACPPRRRIL
jgi:CO/xanthine dehydrogenase Mo-binding subunit